MNIVFYFISTLFLSTQPYTKSSCPLNLVHFQPVNSTLAFAWQQAPRNEKIREPEKNSQLSEMPCFQAFFGIHFCTFDINTTHSTCQLWQNKSTGCTAFTSYPYWQRYLASLANVEGLQDTYTIRLAPLVTNASSTGASQPLRGGSITATFQLDCPVWPILAASLLPWRLQRCSVHPGCAVHFLWHPAQLARWIQFQ